MEQLLINAGAARREVVNGREYLVAPMTIIVPGVLNGSRGALLYPPSEVSREPGMWNGVPIVRNHPTENGNHVSGRTPSAMAKFELGRVFNDTWDGSKRTAEGWFDVENTKRVDPSIYNRLVTGQSIELSTGLFTDNEDRKGTWNGKPYDAIAYNYRPDHLAILPDQVGACSNKDGCGVMVNAQTANAFCPGEGARDNSCSSSESSGSTPSSYNQTESKRIETVVQSAMLTAGSQASITSEKLVELVVSSLRYKADRLRFEAQEQRDTAEHYLKNPGLAGKNQETLQAKFFKTANDREKEATREEKLAAKVEKNGIHSSLVSGIKDLKINQDDSQSGPAEECTCHGTCDECAEKIKSKPINRVKNAFCPGEGIKDNSCGSDGAKGGTFKPEKQQTFDDIRKESLEFMRKKQGRGVIGSIKYGIQKVFNDDDVANAFCPGEGARDNSCSSSGSAGSSASMKVEIETDPNKTWAGKYKIGEKQFVSKKDANEYIKAVKVAEKTGKDITSTQWHEMPEKQQKVWAETHLPGYREMSIEDRNKAVKEFVTDLSIKKSEADSLRPDGTKKNIFDHWAESAKEWEKANRTRNAFIPIANCGGEGSGVPGPCPSDDDEDAPTLETESGKALHKVYSSALDEGVTPGDLGSKVDEIMGKMKPKEAISTAEDAGFYMGGVKTKAGAIEQVKRTIMERRAFHARTKIDPNVKLNAFCPGEGARDNSCSSSSEGGMNDKVFKATMAEHSDTKSKYELVSGVASRLSSGTTKLKDAINQLKARDDTAHLNTKLKILAAVEKVKQELHEITDKAGKANEWAKKQTHNAFAPRTPSDPRSTRGQFKPMGSGMGKGPAHEAAQAGSLLFTDADRANGKRSVMGDHEWASDPDKLSRAMEEALKNFGPDDNERYWSATAAIYRKMGGVSNVFRPKQLTNAN